MSRDTKITRRKEIHPRIPTGDSARYVDVSSGITPGYPRMKEIRHHAKGRVIQSIYFALFSSTKLSERRKEKKMAAALEEIISRLLVADNAVIQQVITPYLYILMSTIPLSFYVTQNFVILRCFKGLNIKSVRDT